MEQSNNNKASFDSKGLKKSSVAKSNPSFFSKLFGYTNKNVYEFQDDLYKIDEFKITKWKGDVIKINGKIFPNGKEWFYGEGGKKIKREIKSFKLTNGNFYTGEWKDGKQEGKGKYIWLNGDSYEGEWKDGKMEGEGRFTWLAGDSYSGTWKGNKKQGKGIFAYKKDIHYEGEWKDNIATDFSKIIITDLYKNAHTITKEGQLYFYQTGGGEKQEIDMGNEKRLKSVLLQFGSTEVNQQNAVTMKDSTELSKFIEEKKNTANAKPSMHGIVIPGHAFTMLFEKGKAYCFDNGGLNNDSLQKWRVHIKKNKVEYVNLTHEPNLKFQLKDEDRTKIDIPINADSLQYCCRHKSNGILEKLEELKSELKENENLYDKFNKYLEEVSKRVSGGVPQQLMRINSRRNSFQQDEDMSIAMENGVVNKVKISNYKALHKLHCTSSKASNSSCILLWNI